MSLFKSGEEKQKTMLKKYDKKFDETVKAGIEAREKLVEFLTKDQWVTAVTESSPVSIHRKEKRFIPQLPRKEAKEMANNIISMQQKLIKNPFHNRICIKPSSDGKTQKNVFSIENPVKAQAKRGYCSPDYIKEVDSICSPYIKTSKALAKMDEVLGGDKLGEALKNITEKNTDSNRDKENTKNSKTKFREAIKKAMKER